MGLKLERNQSSFSSSLSLVVQPNLQGPSHELDTVQLLNGLRGIGSGLESNETESLLAAIPSDSDIRTIDLANLTEVIFEILPTCFPG
mmetsp:Transcript_22005/g.53261  ORF Transcript_22005/g.53261 Transcript_22005/m.53261 type:complete len:88 (-) Transcript_22005:512-775(-)